MDIYTYIPLNGAVNARHLGGYASRYGSGSTRDFTLFRSDYPGEMNEQDLDKLYELGVRTFIDIRSESELLRNPTMPRGDTRFQVLHRPLLGFDASPTGAASLDIDDMRVFYRDILDTCQIPLRSVFDVLLDTDGACFYYCTAGKDRTGIVSMLMLLLAGVSREDVTRDYLYTQVLLEPKRAAFAASMPDAARRENVLRLLDADVSYIDAALDHLESNFKDAESYFRLLGYGDAEISALRAILV